MKRLAMALSAVAALSACSSDVSAPALTPDSGSAAVVPDVQTGSRSADTQTQSTSIPYDLTAPIGCLGETIQLSGELHLLFHITLHRNRVTIMNHTNAQGVSGIGLTSGRRLQGVNRSHSVFNSGDPAFGPSDGNGAQTFSGITTFHMISQGAGNNLLFHQWIIVTIDATGILRVDRERLSIECR